MFFSIFFKILEMNQMYENLMFTDPKEHLKSITNIAPKDEDKNLENILELCRKHPKSALNEKHRRFKECQFFRIGNSNCQILKRTPNNESDIENTPEPRISIDTKRRNQINSTETKRRKQLKIWEKTIKKKLKK